MSRRVTSMVDGTTKTPIGTAWIDAEGILWHRLDEGVSVSGSLAERTAEVLSEVLAERPAPAIVDITNLSFADEEARDVFARFGSAAPEVATAILLRSQDDHVPSMLSYFFSKLEADRPIGFFDNEHAAVAWARRFLKSAPSE
ncbi:MAG: hypothetical protein OEO79_11070 [Gemmatimonadota bacterium]|nr:hypothetical protein [Gemmatimonadota bacterium]MDH3423867.1 hypothetical protein [Gemmatimonadota bacterium]